MSGGAKDKITGLTAQQERFAQCMATGKMNQSEAYRDAYPRSQKWKETAVYAASSEMAAHSKVSLRIKELQAKVETAVIKRTAIDKAWVMDRLQRISDRCMQVEPVLDKKGDPVFVETENGSWAPAFTFNSMGANRATELIGKEFGMFVERKETGPPGAFKEEKADITARIKDRSVRLGVAKVFDISAAAGKKAKAAAGPAPAQYKGKS